MEKLSCTFSRQGRLAQGVSAEITGNFGRSARFSTRGLIPGGQYIGVADRLSGR
jgi:hypothetical protein